MPGGDLPAELERCLVQKVEQAEAKRSLQRPRQQETGLLQLGAAEGGACFDVASQRFEIGPKIHGQQYDIILTSVKRHLPRDIQARTVVPRAKDPV